MSNSNNILKRFHSKYYGEIKKENDENVEETRNMKKQKIFDDDNDQNQNNQSSNRSSSNLNGTTQERASNIDRTTSMTNITERQQDIQQVQPTTSAAAGFIKSNGNHSSASATDMDEHDEISHSTTTNKTSNQQKTRIEKSQMASAIVGCLI